MRIEITTGEARVIGSLIEKEITTPEYYPLSLSSLTQACNQKSSRDPVMKMRESEVQDMLDSLAKKHLISDRTGFGSRVTKYQHRFCNVGFGSLELTAQELGVICVLLLRGPQTPGELRTRTNRLCEFSDVHETEAVLRQLMEREDGPFVARLPREPGKRESRYMHLFSGEPDEVDTSAGEYVEPSRTESERNRLETVIESLEARIEALEARVSELEGN